jgi:hypothetical protein
MANTYKILGQSNPATNVETVLYTVPAVTNAIVNCITICNSDSISTKFRLSISVGGAATTSKDIIYNSVSVTSNDTAVINAGFTLNAGDVVRIIAYGPLLSFNLFGTEIT